MGSAGSVAFHGRTIWRVAKVGLVAFVLGAVVVAAIALLNLAPGQRRRRTRIIAGLAPGIIGAGLVATLYADVIPDDFETTALPWLIVAITVGLAILTFRNLAAD